jgi:hypothetical protein
MSTGEESTAAPGSRHGAKPPDNGDTGLPAFHTWPKLYTFVLGCFVLWMLLLFVLEQCFR